MNYDRCLITITDVVSSTSMPVNEFALYRYNHFRKERQIVILLFKDKINKDIVLPNNIDVICIGKKAKMLKNVVDEIVKTCTELRIPYVFHIHEAKSVIFFNLATFFKYHSHIVYTLHSTYTRYPLHNKIFAYIATLISKYVVCVSKTSYKYFPRHLCLIFKDKILAIQNGVDIERVDCIREQFFKVFNATKDSTWLHLVYVARLVELKRHNMLFNIIKKTPFVRLTLIGEGPLKENLIQISKDMGISNRVFFKGALPREEVYKEICKNDIYVSTSSYEGLPISVLEAMCCARICIVSDIEQHKEISKRCDGLITVEDDISKWINLLAKIYQMDKSEREKIGIKNYVDVGKSFSLDEMHNRYNLLYKNII